MITKHIADDVQTEVTRLQAAVNALRGDLALMLEHRDFARDGEHRDVLEALRMVAYDRQVARASAAASRSTR